MDKLFVILPFEKDFYKKHNYDVVYEGHPLIDYIDRKIKDIPGRKVFYENNDLDLKPIIAVLAHISEQKDWREAALCEVEEYLAQTGLKEYPFFVIVEPTKRGTIINK